MMKINNEVPLRENDDGYFGRLYEKIRGVGENNSTGPDLPHERTELKSKRAGSNSKTSMFCLEPFYDVHATIFNPRQLLEKYKNEKGRFNTCIKIEPNNRGFFLQLSEDGKNFLLCKVGEKTPIARWDLDAIVERANRKLPNMDLAKFNEDGSYEEEKYRNFKKEKFRDLLLRGEIVVETRMRDGNLSGKKAKNRGTVFRMSADKIGELYESKGR